MFGQAEVYKGELAAVVYHHIGRLHVEMVHILAVKVAQGPGGLTDIAQGFADWQRSACFHELIQALTLRENLIFAQQVGGKKADKDKVDELLMEFDLLDRGDFFPHQLSGGQRRRAMAARCLIHNPLLILADEPTNDLDGIWAEKIIQMLKREASRGAGVVMVTHNTHWAKQANRRCYLEDGALFPVTEETAAL